MVLFSVVDSSIRDFLCFQDIFGLSPFFFGRMLSILLRLNDTLKRTRLPDCMAW